MTKIKLTKGELKRQRDSLRQFQHYLPTLQLKKQQLQMTILQARTELEKKKKQAEAMEIEIRRWAGLLADPGILVTKWIEPQEVIKETVNIAGAVIPVLKSVQFADIDYDYYVMPFWMNRGIKELRKFIHAICEINTIEEKIRILQHELRVTTQRVNLFEKIKIPQCLDNIRVIRIYLGDQMANAVGISKVAKKKIEMQNLETTAV